MRILLLNYEYPPLGGGAGVVTRAQAEGFAALGHEVTVVTAGFDDLKNEEVSDGLHIIRLPSYRKYRHKSGMREKISWMLAATGFLKTYLQQHNFDACLTHFSFPGGYVARRLKTWYKLPYVVVSHGHDIPWFFPQQMLLYHTLLYFPIKRILAEASGVVVLNAALRNSARRFLPHGQRNKVHLIPNGCDTSFFKPAPEGRLNNFTIVFSGRLTKQKDPMTFLKAIDIFSREELPFSVLVMGDGPLRPQMEAFVRERPWRSKVVFAGWVSASEAARDLSTAHVHVMCSRAEAMSVAAIESLSSGVYLISTNTGAAAELISANKNGTIVPQRNPQALSQSLLVYYNLFFLKRMEVASDVLQDFRLRYDWRNIMGSYVQLLTNIQK